MPSDGVSQVYFARHQAAVGRARQRLPRDRSHRLLISLSTARYAYRAPFASLSYQLRRHRAITRTLIAALSLALAAAVSAGGAAQAGLTTILPAPASILPVGVGMGIGRYGVHDRLLSYSGFSPASIDFR